MHLLSIAKKLNFLVFTTIQSWELIMKSNVLLYFLERQLHSIVEIALVLSLEIWNLYPNLLLKRCIALEKTLSYSEDKFMIPSSYVTLRFHENYFWIILSVHCGIFVYLRRKDLSVPHPLQWISIISAMVAFKF